MKRAIRIALVLVVLLVVSASAALWEAGRAGSGSVEGWIAGQVRTVADAYLNPKLTFDDLDYVFPSTVRLKHLRLTADDPHAPPRDGAAGKLDIVSAEEVQIELAEVPKVGRPIRLASVVLVKPVFRAVATGDGTAHLVGFSDLIRHGVRLRDALMSAVPASATIAPSLVPASAPVDDAAETSEKTQATASATTLVAPSAQAGATTQAAPPHLPRISQFMQIRRVEIVDGRIVSDPRLPGVPVMELDRINTKLDIQPSGDGWYALRTRITREPVFDLSVAGRVDLDTFTADAEVTLTAQVGRENERYLPPGVQQFLREHEIRGALAGKFSGTIPLLDPARGRMRAEVTLKDANLSIGDYRVPVDALGLSAELADKRLTLTSLHVDALRGQADVAGSLLLDPQLNGDVRVAVTDMLLDDTIRDGTRAAAQPTYGGRVNARIAAAAPLKVVMAKALAHRGSDGTSTSTSNGCGNSGLAAEPLLRRWGEGEIRIDRARLTSIPVISELAHTIDRGASLVAGNGGRTRPNERAAVAFELGGDGARCGEITYVGTVFAARGRGTVTLDRQLDLVVNAGPLEKMQSLMGDTIGGTFGKLTDALAGYHVTGPIERPQVEVELAGGVVNKAGRAVGTGIGKTANAVGDGVGKAANAVGDGVGAVLGGIGKLAGVGND